MEQERKYKAPVVIFNDRQSKEKITAFLREHLPDRVEVLDDEPPNFNSLFQADPSDTTPILFITGNGTKWQRISRDERLVYNYAPDLSPIERLTDAFSATRKPAIDQRDYRPLRRTAVLIVKRTRRNRFGDESFLGELPDDFNYAAKRLDTHVAFTTKPPLTPNSLRRELVLRVEKLVTYHGRESALDDKQTENQEEFSLCWNQLNPEILQEVRMRNDLLHVRNQNYINFNRTAQGESPESAPDDFDKLMKTARSLHLNTNPLEELRRISITAGTIPNPDKK